MKIAFVRKIFIPVFMLMLGACRPDVISPDEIVAPEAKKGEESEIKMSNTDALIKSAVIKKRTTSGYQMTVTINTSESDAVVEIDVKIKASKGSPSPIPKKLTLHLEEADLKSGIATFTSDMLDFEDDAVGKTYEVTFTMLDAMGKKIGKVKKEELTVEPAEANLPLLESIRIINTGKSQWTCSVVMSDPGDALDYVEVEFLDENTGPAPSDVIISLSYAGEVNLDQELYTGTLSFEGDPTKTNYSLLVHGFSNKIKILTIQTATTPVFSDI